MAVIERKSGRTPVAIGANSTAGVDLETAIADRLCKRR
jgi:hypothetical protein